MKPLLVLAGLALAATFFALCEPKEKQTGPGNNPEHELRERLREWDEAYARRDTEALSRILADDFIFTDAIGTVNNKAQYIMAVIKSPDITLIESVDSDDLIIRLYGDTAVIMGRSWIRERPRQPALRDLFRFTDVWVKRQVRWQVVASLVTRVTGKLRPG
jgi:ketosteroid isomerase-like protein